MGKSDGRPKRYSLAVELTPFCNQKCGYCYNDWRDDTSRARPLPGAELVGLVERAVTDVEFDHVTLTGGEPFAWPHVFDMLGMLERQGLKALIISNGGLVTEDIATRLAPFDPIWVQITLNGPEAALHEEHVGKNCFEPTLAGVRALVARGVNVAGSIVVTRKNAAKVTDILEVFRGLGVTNIALSRYSPAGYAAEQIAELLPARRDLVTALDQGEAHAKAHGTSLQVTMPVPPCVIEHSDYPSIRFSTCPIGTEMQEFSLGSDGKLRHCTLHTGAIGDGKTESFADLVDAPAVTRYRDTTPEFCAPCPHKSSCIGGCGAAAATVSGDARGLDPLVAQHVDDELAARLKAARAGTQRLIPLGRKRPAAPAAVGS
jgi:radical SAM protein with 4Fe4S-binding SPASM domain